MKIVQINSVLNTGSTGRIAEQIGQFAMSRGHESLIAYGRVARDSKSRAFRIGNLADVVAHGAQSLILDRQGLGSRKATMSLVQWLESERPDVIGLHNLHGYYLNYQVLFDYLGSAQIPIIWTLHDCWPFTGHCAYFDRYDCRKWESGCSRCPMTGAYPKSLLDFSNRNFRLKKHYFRSIPSMTIVTPSKWLKNFVRRSFLSEYPVRVINNGVDLNIFRPPERNNGDGVSILGVANVWSERKGLRDFVELRKLLPHRYRIKLVGVTKAQNKSLPDGLQGIARTESVDDLVALYQDATILVNPTYSDNFPTTNIESLACGTPVITYETGGSPESVDCHTGRVVEAGDVQGLAEAVSDLAAEPFEPLRAKCRARAKLLYDQRDRHAEYVDLLESSVQEH